MNKNKKSGFTLVELAIVIVIIGLLVGGVVQGQALIRTSELNTIVSELKAIESATYLYKDKYNAIPGDDINALTKFPNCATDIGPCTNGDASQLIATTETAFSHLVAANLLKKTLCQIPFTNSNNRYASSVKNVCYIIYSSTSIMWGSALGSVITGAPATIVLFTPNDIQYIDTKIDDGIASNGKLLSIGTGGLSATTCVDNNNHNTLGAGAGNYNLTSDAKACNLYYKLGI